MDLLESIRNSFSNSYEEARDRFLKAAKAKQIVIQSYINPNIGSLKEELSCDTRNDVVITSFCQILLNILLAVTSFLKRYNTTPSWPVQNLWISISFIWAKILANTWFIANHHWRIPFFILFAAHRGCGPNYVRINIFWFTTDVGVRVIH